MNRGHISNRGKSHFCVALAASMILTLFTGCSSSLSSGDGGEINELLLSAISQAQSVETAITLDMKGSVGDFEYADGESHNAAISSDITISSSFDPAAYHVDAYSSILVDGVMSRETVDIYVVQDGTDYVEYTYNETEDEWTKRLLTRPEILSIPGKTGVISDWSLLMQNLTYSTKNENSDGTTTLVYSGTVDSSILNEIFANGIFGSFMKSVEWLLVNDIPCTLEIGGESGLPEEITLDFADSFLVSDMTFSTATVSVRYSDWNEGDEVTIPKKYSVVATDKDASFYSTYYAWNLFLPYVGGQITSGNNSTVGSSFKADWESYQIRIDGGMTTMPFAFEDLQKLGYVIDDKHTGIIIEPNQYYTDVSVHKGGDKVVCSFYNDDTAAQPIVNCKIGAMSIAASDQTENGIKVFLPGEVTLGITREALLSAYGEPDEIISGFSCDTLTWYGDGDLQSLLVEISPVTDLVIRLQLENIPVTGGMQNSEGSF